ncbi:MAG TPA: oligosaccharide flippase family protein [Candidatus Omnitrophota bacterium]|nr:oligosaccharide flippase family protein [Candidatus Omnitrophota bacterium]HRZ14111.1 oligosaccharide flippase family protein [Candidatus Omnitrophota bacterium]
MKSSLIQKVGSVSIILGVAAIAELLTNVILGRLLPPNLFGRFKFINTVVIMLSSLLLFGQNMAIIRVFNRENIKEYDWKKFIRSCLLFSSLFAAVGCIIVGLMYHLKKEMLFAYFAVVAAVGTEYYSALLRSQDRYSSSMLLSKTNSIFFSVCVAMMCFVFKIFSFWGLIFVYTLIFFSTFVLGNLVTHRLPSGEKAVSARFVKEGIVLFFITFSYTVMVQVDQFFISKMLGFSKLADYVVVITVTRGFELVATALWFVMMPHYAKDNSRPIKNDSIKAGILAIVVCIGYLFAGQPLLHWFFKGRYDHSAHLLVFFIAAGFFRILYAIPAGIIGGRLPKNLLQLFLGTCILGIFFNLCLNFFLIPLWGLAGAALAALVSWVFRVVSAYYVVYKHKVLKTTDIANDVSSFSTFA